MNEEMRPAIAIVVPNTLAGLGLATLIARMMPSADIRRFASFEALAAQQDVRFFHYFISAQVLLEHVSFFLSHATRTIVLTHGMEQGFLPHGFHTLNVFQSEELLVRDFLRLAQAAHTAHGAPPEAVVRAQQSSHQEAQLTGRERDVLRGIVLGQTNKEIAGELNITVTTVISHRKHLTEKLHTKNVSGLTIYAVMHGLVKTEEI